MCTTKALIGWAGQADLFHVNIFHMVLQKLKRTCACFPKKGISPNFTENNRDGTLSSLEILKTLPMNSKTSPKDFITYFLKTHG